MKAEELRTRVLTELRKVAPDVDPETIDPRASFRDQYELDSVDYLQLMMSLEDRLGVAIPDIDYPKLSTLDGCVAYLAALAPSKAPAKARAAGSRRRRGAG